MYRLLVPGALLAIFAIGCCSTADRETLRLLPENAQAMPFEELYQRARTQVNLATEAFYIDDWFDLEDSARALHQTARFMPRSTSIPKGIAKKVPEQSEQLAQEALNLRKAARAKDVQAVNASLQAIHLKIRQMYPEQQ